MYEALSVWPPSGHWRPLASPRCAPWWRSWPGWALTDPRCAPEWWWSWRTAAELSGWSERKSMHTLNHRIAAHEAARTGYKGSGSHLDWHGVCGAVKPRPQRIFDSINTFISITRHLNICPRDKANITLNTHEHNAWHIKGRTKYLFVLWTLY